MTSYPAPCSAAICCRASEGGQGRSPTLRHKWEPAKGYLWLGQGLGCSSACVSLGPNPHARILRINEVM